MIEGWWPCRGGMRGVLVDVVVNLQGVRMV